jgi:hypothetical protein
VLSGFVKKTAPEIVSYSIEDVESFYKTVKAVKSAMSYDSLREKPRL